LVDEILQAMGADAAKSDGDEDALIVDQHLEDNLLFVN